MHVDAPFDPNDGAPALKRLVHYSLYDIEEWKCRTALHNVLGPANGHTAHS